MLRPSPLWTVALPDYAPDVRWSPDGREVGAATVAAPALVFDAATGAVRWQTAGHPGGSLSLAWCPSAPLLATGGADGAVALHPSGHPRGEAVTVTVGRGWVERLAWSPDGAVLAAAAGRAVRFYSRDGSLVGEYDGHPSTVTALAWHRPSEAWLTAAYGVISMLRPGAADPVAVHYFRTSLLTVHPSPDGRFVACGTQDPLAHVWDLQDETNEVNLTGYTGKVTALAWSPRRPVLATGAGASVVAWDFTDGDPFRHPPREVAVGAGRVTALTFLADGALLAGTDTGAVVVLDLAAPPGAERVAVIAAAPGQVCALVPSPDGRAVLAVAAGGHLVALAAVDDGGDAGGDDGGDAG